MTHVVTTLPAAQVRIRCLVRIMLFKRMLFWMVLSRGCVLNQLFDILPKRLLRELPKKLRCRSVGMMFYQSTNVMSNYIYVMPNHILYRKLGRS